MNRPVSPLLHDYKPSSARKAKKTKALQWFVVGLGIHLIGLTLVSTLNMPTPVTPHPTMPRTRSAVGAAHASVRSSIGVDRGPAGRECNVARLHDDGKSDRTGARQDETQIHEVSPTYDPGGFLPLPRGTEKGTETRAAMGKKQGSSGGSARQLTRFLLLSVTMNGA